MTMGLQPMSINPGRTLGLESHRASNSPSTLDRSTTASHALVDTHRHHSILNRTPGDLCMEPESTTKDMWGEKGDPANVLTRILGWIVGLPLILLGLVGGLGDEA